MSGLLAALWASDQSRPWDREEEVQDHWPASIVLACSVQGLAFPPTLSPASRPGQPVLEHVDLATTNANGGEYDLISSTVNWHGYSGRKREIPTILADGGISQRQV